jgi:dUTPase
MNFPAIPIYLNDELKAALTINGIDPANYGPAYGGESVAIDLYNASEKPFIPDSRGLMPTGLHTALPPGWGAFVFDRGSIHKTDFIHRAGVIDPGYSGEIFVSVKDLQPLQTILPYTKSPFQLVFLPCNTNLQQVSKEEFDALHAASKRLTGKIGSSN